MGQTYFLNGNAIANGNNCYSLTPNIAWQNGTVWYADQIDLTQAFSLEFYMNFGSADAAGADGMVFVLQTVGTSAIGQAGGGIGFQGFNPSFGIEFDTFENAEISDIASDHVAFLKNGNVAHNNINNLSGPVQASSTLANVEDGQNHIVKITWNPNTQIVQLYFDCVLRLSTQVNLINSIFNGNPNVFWGFTGATGGMYNQQSVCLGDYLISDNNPDPICAGTSLEISASGNPLGTFSWSPATNLSSTSIQNPIATPSENTTYTCVYTDLCNQQFTSEIMIEVENYPIINAGVDTFFCEGFAYSLNGTSSESNANIYWTTSSGNILSASEGLNPVVDASGTYTLNVTTLLASCYTSDNVFIDEVPLPIFELTSPVLLCPDESIVIDAGQNWDSVVWNTNQTTSSISVDEPGNYSATVNLNGCETSSSVIVNVVDMPIIDLGPDIEICEGTATILSAGIIGEWSNGQNSLNITIYNAGNFSLNYELDGCIAEDEIIVSAVVPPEFDLGNAISFCEGDTVFLEIPFDGIWSDDTVGNSAFFTTPGNVGVTVVNDVCSVSDQVLLILQSPPALDLGNDLIYCLGDPITLSALDENIDTYLWNTEEITPTIEIVTDGDYSVEVSNECGVRNDSVSVVFEECNYYIYIPNSFTPNNDGINDFWFVYAENLTKYEVLIYDRYGSMIFTSNDKSKPWMGDINNGEYFVPNGVYIYQIKFETTTGDAGEERGIVTVIR